MVEAVVRSAVEGRISDMFVATAGAPRECYVGARKAEDRCGMVRRQVRVP